MPNFSDFSKQRLRTCDMDLQRLFNEVIRHFDCRVMEGHRGRDRQNELCDIGRSKLRYPDSKHNSHPSKAVDVVPYPVDFDDIDRMRMFGGFVLGVASQLGIPLRWGGDWDMDMEVGDNTFNDLPHFELRRDT